MKTLFNAAGRNTFLTNAAPVILDNLPPATYSLRFSPDHGLYLEEIEPFEMPSKIYGDIDHRAARITSTYKSRPNVTGVLLSGEKGSGKTLLAKKLAIDLLNEGQPIITVNMPVSGDMFGTFLQRLQKPVTLFFDEFEKVFTRENQEGLLTILDGVYPFKGLAIMTSNDNSNMADALINRPGRIFYKIAYDGLDYLFAEDYAKDKLKDKSRVEEVLRLVTLSSINFDQLQALIEEMNRYDESAQASVQLLNIDAEPSAGSAKLLKLMTPEGIEIDIKNCSRERIYFEYGSTDVYYRYPSSAGITVREFHNQLEHRRLWPHYAGQWKETFAPLVEAIRADNASILDQKMPFLCGLAYITIPNAEEEFEGDDASDAEKPYVKALPGNNIAIRTTTGHIAVLKRMKPTYSKSF